MAITINENQGSKLGTQVPNQDDPRLRDSISTDDGSQRTGSDGNDAATLERIENQRRLEEERERRVSIEAGRSNLSRMSRSVTASDEHVAAFADASNALAILRLISDFILSFSRPIISLFWSVSILIFSISDSIRSYVFINT